MSICDTKTMYVGFTQNKMPAAFLWDSVIVKEIDITRLILLRDKRYIFSQNYALRTCLNKGLEDFNYIKGI